MRLRLEQGVGEFEDDARAAEIGKIAAQLRVDQRDAVRTLIGGFVVIENDEVGAAPANFGGFARGIGSAIDRNEQGGGMFLETARHPGGAQPIAFLHAQRQEAADAPAEGGEQSLEQRDGRDTIHIVVAVKDNFLAVAQGTGHAFRRRRHAGDFSRIAETAQFGIQKRAGVRGVGQAIAQEDLGEKFRNAQLARQPAGIGGAIAFRKNPTPLHGRGAYGPPPRDANASRTASAVVGEPCMHRMLALLLALAFSACGYSYHLRGHRADALSAPVKLRPGQRQLALTQGFVPATFGYDLGLISADPSIARVDYRAFPAKPVWLAGVRPGTTTVYYGNLFTVPFRAKDLPAWGTGFPVTVEE